GTEVLRRRRIATEQDVDVRRSLEILLVGRVPPPGRQAQSIGHADRNLAESGPRFGAGGEGLVGGEGLLVIPGDSRDILVEVDRTEQVIDRVADIAGPAGFDAGLLVLLGREGRAE